MGSCYKPGLKVSSILCSCLLVESKANTYAQIRNWMVLSTVVATDVRTIPAAARPFLQTTISSLRLTQHNTR